MRIRLGMSQITGQAIPGSVLEDTGVSIGSSICGHSTYHVKSSRSSTGAANSSSSSHSANGSFDGTKPEPGTGKQGRSSGYWEGIETDSGASVPG